MRFRKIDLQPSLRQALAGERAIAYTACIDPERMASESGSVTPEEARQIAQRQPTRVSDAVKMLELNLRIAEGADTSLSAALRASEEADAEMNALQTGLVNKMNYALTLLLTPAYDSAVTAFARRAARRDCADAAFAAELYRRKNGNWPESLEKLVPEYLPAVPLDPFANQPLKMVVTAEECKIYSVGQDRKDSLGNLSDRADPDTDIGLVFPLRRKRMSPNRSRPFA